MRSVVIKPTKLVDRLVETGLEIYVKRFVDSKNRKVLITDTGTPFSVVLQQGKDEDAIYEIVKIIGITQNTDGTAKLTIQANGRDVDPTSPYASYASGNTFDIGADIIVSNDAFAMSRYANLDEPINFTVTPQITADPVNPNDVPRKSYIDALLGGTITLTKSIIQGKAGEAVAIQNIAYFDVATNSWKLADKTTSATFVNTKLGIILSTTLNGATIANGIQVSGYCAGFTGLTAGAKVYLGLLGAMTQVATGYRRTLGFAISATEIYFDVDFDTKPTVDEKDALGGSNGTPSATNKFVTQSDSKLMPTGTILPFMGLTVPSSYLLCDGSLVSRTTYATLFSTLISTVGVATISVNTPATVTRTAHGLSAGDQIYFTSTGSLPTGLATNTKYYVIATGITANTFQISATINGTAINTTGTQSGIHTIVLTGVNLGDGSTTFQLPDFRGKVLVAEDPTQTEFQGLGNGGGEKTHILTIPEMPSHNHNANGWGIYTGGNDGVNRLIPNVNNNYSNLAAPNLNVTSTGGDGAHNNLQPYSIVNYIIKI